MLFQKWVTFSGLALHRKLCLEKGSIETNETSQNFIEKCKSAYSKILSEMNIALPKILEPSPDPVAPKVLAPKMVTPKLLTTPKLMTSKVLMPKILKKSKKIINARSAERKSQVFTDDQSKMIQKYFSENIQSKKVPAKKKISEFMEEHKFEEKMYFQIKQRVMSLILSEAKKEKKFVAKYLSRSKSK